jgi:hypothetical protein
MGQLPVYAILMSVGVSTVVVVLHHIDDCVRTRVREIVETIAAQDRVKEALQQ